MGGKEGSILQCPKWRRAKPTLPFPLSPAPSSSLVHKWESRPGYEWGLPKIRSLFSFLLVLLFSGSGQVLAKENICSKFLEELLKVNFSMEAKGERKRLEWGRHSHADRFLNKNNIFSTMNCTAVEQFRPQGPRLSRY